MPSQRARMSTWLRLPLIKLTHSWVFIRLLGFFYSWQTDHSGQIGFQMLHHYLSHLADIRPCRKKEKYICGEHMDISAHRRCAIRPAPYWKKGGIHLFCDAHSDISADQCCPFAWCSLRYWPGQTFIDCLVSLTVELSSRLSHHIQKNKSSEGTAREENVLVYVRPYTIAVW